MDQPPSDFTEPLEKTAEQAAARAVAAEESARQRAWRETARSSTTVIPKPVRQTRLLLPVLAISSLMLALTCGILFFQMQGLESQESQTRRRLPPTTRAPLPPQEPTLPTLTAPLILPVVSDAQTPAQISPPPPTPLVITIPIPAPLSPPAAVPPIVPPTVPPTTRAAVPATLREAPRPSPNRPRGTARERESAGTRDP